MDTIEIRTTQNVVIEYELASLRDRMMAFFLDLVMFFLAYYFIFFFLLSIASRVLTSDDAWLMTFFGFLPIAGWILYHLLMEIFNKGQSLGKKIIGIKVVRIDGKEPGFSDHFLRAVFQIVDTMFSMGVVASILIASSEKRQRFGDMAANTTIVRTRSNQRFSLQEILGIQSLDNYDVAYPEVKNLQETDLLLIKNALERYQRFPNDAHNEALNQLTAKLTELLRLPNPPGDRIIFLKTLIKDYIVLTR